MAFGAAAKRGDLKSNVAQHLRGLGRIDDVYVQSRAKLKSGTMDETRDDPQVPIGAVMDIIVIDKLVIGILDLRAAKHHGGVWKVSTL